MKLLLFFLSITFYVNIYALTWSIPESISDANLNATTPKVAISGAGEGMVVWYLPEQNDSNIQFSKKSGSGWSSPIDLFSGQGYCYGSIDISSNSSGNLVITGLFGTYANPKRATEGIMYINNSWFSPAQLATGTLQDHNPFSFINENNQAVVFWNEVDENNWYIYESQWINNAWTSAYPVKGPASSKKLKSTLNSKSDNSNASRYNPVGGMNNDGNMVMVWSDFMGSKFTICATEYFTSWTNPISISDPNKHSESPNLSCNNTNEALVVWKTDNTSYWSIACARCIDAIWQPYEQLSGAGGDCNSPIVHMNELSNVVVAWEEFLSNNTRICGKICINGVWSSSFDVSQISNLNTTASNPIVAIDDSDRAIVVWCEKNFNNQIIRCCTNIAGSWSTPQTISDTSGFHSNVDISINFNGDIIVAWEKQECTSCSEIGIIQVTDASFAL